MPKRMLDSSLLTSPSLARVSPRAQDAFPRLIVLADDFGCFDANPRIMLGRGWPLREDVSPADIAGWLQELEAVGMLERWDEDGRRWGYLPGWFGPHGQRERDEYHPKENPKGSKRHATPPSVRKGAEPTSRGGPAAGANRETEVPAADPRTQSQAAVAVAVASYPQTPAAEPASGPEPGGQRAPEKPLGIEETQKATAAWPLVDEFRRRIAERLALDSAWMRLAGSGRKPNDVRDKLEGEIARLGMERAVAVGAELAIREHKRCSRPVRYLAFWADVLPDVPTVEEPPRRGGVAEPERVPMAAALTAARASCPEWAGLLERAAGGGMNRDAVERWLTPLLGSKPNGVLELVAPSLEHAAFVGDHYADRLREWSGGDVRIVAGNAGLLTG